MEKAVVTKKGRKVKKGVPIKIKANVLVRYVAK